MLSESNIFVVRKKTGMGYKEEGETVKKGYRKVRNNNCYNNDNNTRYKIRRKKKKIK